MKKLILLLLLSSIILLYATTSRVGIFDYMFCYIAPGYDLETEEKYKPRVTTTHNQHMYVNLRSAMEDKYFLAWENRSDKPFEVSHIYMKCHFVENTMRRYIQNIYSRYVHRGKN